MAQRAADAELSEARRGIDETEPSAAAKLEAIRDGLRRGLSPEQIAATRPELGLAASTIYRWVDAGYAEMTNMELRRKVGYRPRRKSAPAGAGRHSRRRSHAEFGALPGDARAGAWEMDTVVGRASDSARLLTLYHRPTGFQLAIPVPDGTCASTLAGLGLVRAALGPEGMRRVFRLVLTDNGPELADEGEIAALLGELPGETRLFYCDPRRRRARDVAGQLRAARQARLAVARRDAPRRARGGRARPHGRVRCGAARARRARPDGGVRGARPRREGRGAAGGVAPRGQPNGTRPRRAESGGGARRVGGACPSDSSRRPATNPTPAGTCAGDPLRGLPPVSIAAETRYAVKVFR